MEQHPIPRQITTFEFKLIGFMTLRQFLYLIVFSPLAYVVYALFPIPIINVLLAIVVAGIGIAFAFFQLQDRPLDVWIKNFIKRMRSPTQYMYHKQNQGLQFLKGLYFQTDPHVVMAHIDSQEKLSAYLTQKKTEDVTKKQKENIQNILKHPGLLTTKVRVDQTQQSAPVTQQPTTTSLQTQPQVGLKHPFLTGVIRNNRQIPLPGILVYIKDHQNNTLRLLKTNPHGVFATYSPLPANEYMIEMKDPNAGYFFDTMKVKIDTDNPTPLKFYSKELL